MKKSLFIIAGVVYITTLCFFQTASVSSTKNLASDNPVVIIPPYKILGTKSTPFIIKTKTLPNSTTKLV